MARSHGRILASIWNDDDFLALDPSAQRLYMLLVSQSNLTHAGTMPTTLRRWARMSKETDQDDVRYAVELLEESRFVVIDWDTEELLIRTLIRNDGVFKQPNVLAAAANEARAIVSPRLRHALREELERLPLDEVAPKARTDVQAIVKELSDSLATPALTLPVTLPGTPRQATQSSDVTTLKPSMRTRALSPSPTPSPSPTVSDGRENAPHPDTAQTLIAEHIDACRARPPGNVVGQLAKNVGVMLGEGIDPDAIRAGLAKYREKPMHPSTLPSLVNEIVNAPARPADRRFDASGSYVAWDA